MFYLVKTPSWLMKLYPTRIWKVNTDEKKVFLSFDDGPDPEVTGFVLDQLLEHGAKATFFCLGKNVKAFPHLYRRILDEEHACGNHGFNHLNGWQTKDKEYMADIKNASDIIDSNLFRPPYGRLTNFQARLIGQKMHIVMWSLLSGDFDLKLNADQCLANVILNIHPGAIIVFHDSEKSFPKLKEVLPKLLDFLDDKGFEAVSLTEEVLKKSGPG